MAKLRQRLAAAVLTLVVALLLCFALGEMAPGDALTELQLDPSFSPQVLASLRARYLPQHSYGERLRAWLVAAAHGDLGYSLQYHRPVLSLLRERLAPSLELMALALALAWTLGLALALAPEWLGERGWRRWRRATQALAAGGGSLLAAVPISVLAILALVAAPTGPNPGPWAAGLVLGLAFLPTVYFQAAHALAGQMRRPYVWQARAGGIAPHRLVLRHALPNTADVLIPLASLTTSQALVELVIVENLMGWPGLGQLALRASTAHDMPLVAAIVLLTSGLVVVANCASDLVQTAFNPRLQAAGDFDAAPRGLAQGAG